MRIQIVTPKSDAVGSGNDVTARRWARLLGELGHRVRLSSAYTGGDCDLLVALHARKSHPSVTHFRRAHPRAPLVVALTGTDLYRDLPRSRQARRSLQLATRIVVLQSEAPRALPQAMRGKTRVIFQSAPRSRGRVRQARRDFEVCLLAHLRPVKDPLRAARAARLLPPESRVRIVHAGAALTSTMARQARGEAERNPRYHWLGPVSRPRALRLLARSRCLVLTSRLEGAANVVAEALAAGVPILSSRISGVIGTLGPRYPGYFPVGDTGALAALLRRAETDGAFYQELRDRCRHLAPLADPRWERETWRELLSDINRG
jgi:putative glycosyltransferase (TIGR04348 family)